MREPRTIAISGPDGDVTDALAETAAEVGALLARDGVLVVTGGLGGVMAAAARGARAAGGQVLGLLPGIDTVDANEHLSIAVPTGMGQARNALLVAAADALVAVGGSWGTLSEIALAMRAGKPVVCLHGWVVHDADGAPLPLPIAETPPAALALIRAALGW